MNHRFLTCGLLLFALTEDVSASPVTYWFSGAMNDSFGTITIGTPFNGSFTYDDSQPFNTPNVSFRGDYSYTSLSVTIGGVTVTDNGPGALYVYNNPDYPTDMVYLLSLTATGSFGGLPLSSSGGLQLVLQDVSGTVFSDPSIPGPGLRLEDFTTGNATFLQLVGTSANDYPIARGELSYVSNSPPPIPEPTSAVLWLTGGAVLLRARRFRRN